MDKNHCPKYPDGQHKLFVYGKTYTEFVPYQFNLDSNDVEMNAYLQGIINSSPELYQRTEYAVLSCQCGHTVRKVVLHA